MTLVAERPAVLSAEHEEIRVRHGARSGLTMVIAIHSTVDGHALGGCRMWRYATADEAVQDAERLSAAMTLKAAAARLPLGGGKGVIALPAEEAVPAERRRAALRDFADLVESFDGRYISGQDAGTCEEDMAYLARFTGHVGGRPVADGGGGDPSPYTAHGVEVAIRASLPDGGASLTGRRVVVVGLGHVGGALAERLHAAGAELVLSDIDRGKRALAERLGARWCAPEDALRAEADVLAPCGLGGVLDAEAVAALRVRAVAGAANNQLADDSVAELLRARGIRWAPDFVANAGGLIAVADERHGFDRARVEAAVERIGDRLGEIYARADERGADTLRAVKEIIEEERA